MREENSSSFPVLHQQFELVDCFLVLTGNFPKITPFSPRDKETKADKSELFPNCKLPWQVLDDGGKRQLLENAPGRAQKQ